MLLASLAAFFCDLTTNGKRVTRSTSVLTKMADHQGRPMSTCSHSMALCTQPDGHADARPKSTKAGSAPAAAEDDVSASDPVCASSSSMENVGTDGGSGTTNAGSSAAAAAVASC